MRSIVVPSHFIRATRNAGYRGLAYAIAELLDNSLDAGATKVDVRVHEYSESSTSSERIGIAVVDDGSGMDRATLDNALKFGGSSDFDSRNRIGRFGMGLPNASLSQTGRVDVFSKTHDGPWLHAYLDVEEIAFGRPTTRPTRRPCIPPSWVPLPEHAGTAVTWSRCDRLPFKRVTTIAEKLAVRLGQIFRRKLQSGFQISINGSPVPPIDPLFRAPLAELKGTCKPYGEPLEYHIRCLDGQSSTITIQFVELPVSRWHNVRVDVKRSVGIVGGAGISVLRAGREIEFGWHLFGSKRRENYDEWWRCELQFEPSLDEWFGITNSKQGISPTPELKALLEPDLERIARDLNARVRKAFQQARRIMVPTSVRRAEERDRLLPAIQRSAVRTRRRSIGGYRYALTTKSLATADLFTIRTGASQIAVTLNANHAFSEVLGQHGRTELELLLLSAARAALSLPEVRRREFIREWSDNLAAFIDA